MKEKHVEKKYNLELSDEELFSLYVGLVEGRLELMRHIKRGSRIYGNLEKLEILLMKKLKPLCGSEIAKLLMNEIH